MVNQWGGEGWPALARNPGDAHQRRPKAPGAILWTGGQVDFTFKRRVLGQASGVYSEKNDEGAHDWRRGAPACLFSSPVRGLCYSVLEFVLEPGLERLNKQ